MVRPSNPKLMARVLEAVTHLGEGKGSLTREVLNFVKQSSSGPARNLTMQVQRALKHAVNAGLLRCKGGRYKMQLELNTVPRRQHRNHEETDSYTNLDLLNEMNEDVPIGGTDITRRAQDRPKATRKKRPARKNRKRSGTRGGKKKATRRRAPVMERRVRKLSKRPKRKTTNADDYEDWPTRRRRMESRSGFDEDEEEDEEEEEDEMIGTRKGPKMRSVNEDRYSDISGDSTVIGRHRSRRSKHLASERRSPTRRGNGDADSRKSSKRSSSRRRRSQPRQRENRQQPAPEEPADDQRVMDEENDNEAMEMDEDQVDGERTVTPPGNQGNE